MDCSNSMLVAVVRMTVGEVRSRRTLSTRANTVTSKSTEKRCVNFMFLPLEVWDTEGVSAKANSHL